jgi:hypothetical protein
LTLLCGRTWKQKHLSLFDWDVSKFSFINSAQQHVALVLIKPFLKAISCQQTRTGFRLHDTLDRRQFFVSLRPS